MAEIKDLLAYILVNYRDKNILSNARLVKLLYLCDWKYTIDYGKPMTNFKWYFDDFENLILKIVETVDLNPGMFKINYEDNLYGGIRKTFRVNKTNYNSSLTDEEKKVVNHVIKTTENKSWGEFINLIYSTYPILNSSKYEPLNLTQMAKEYKHTAIYKSLAAS